MKRCDRRLALVGVWLVVVVSALPAAGQQPPADRFVTELRGKLSREVGQIASQFDGVMGIAVRDLATDENFAVNGDAAFPQASSIKIPILLELLRQVQAGALNPADRVEVRQNHKVGGAGVLQYFGDGTAALSLRDLAALMIVLSDNTATNLLLDRIGLEKVNAFAEALGLAQTRITRRMMDREAARAGRENVSTPREMATLLALLHAGKVLDAERTALALDILSHAKPVAPPLRRGVPPRIRVASKSGELGGVRCDSGIVLLPDRPYAIAVMTTYGRDPEAAEQAITEVSRRVFAHFERLAHSNALGVRVRE